MYTQHREIYKQTSKREKRKLGFFFFARRNRLDESGGGIVNERENLTFKKDFIGRHILS